MGVRPEVLKAPYILSPAKPVKGKSTLTIYTSLMVYPKWPEGVGQALFSSSFQSARGLHSLCLCGRETPGL
jgi:hypothetical protein